MAVMLRRDEHLFEFGPFRLDTAEKVFLKNGEPLPLAPKAFELLAILVERSGHLVDKNDLLEEIWPDSFVEESSLTQNIYVLRKALSESDGEQRYIETVPRRGYRFVADVKAIGDRETAVDIDQQTPAHLLIEAARAPANDTESRLNHIALRASPASRRSLTPVAVALSLLLISVAVASVFLIFRKAPPPAFAARSIAVLPFKILGAEGADEHLGLGMTDAMITKLSSLKQIAVRPTSAIYKYADHGYDLATVGRELNVDAILEGTVQRAGDRVRVNVQLINASDGQPVWAEKFNEQYTSVFAVQDSISEQVAYALRLKVTSESRSQLAKRYTENPEAYQAYTRALYFWNQRTEEGLNRSIRYFKEAIDKDPNYALAYAGLADCYSLIAYYGYKSLATEEAYQKASLAATKALEMDDSIAEAHPALALVKTDHDDDRPAAEREHKQSIALNPSYATGHQRYALFLLEESRLDEAYEEIKRAQELDPLLAVINSNLGAILYMKRDYDRAAEFCRKALEVAPQLPAANYFLGLIYTQKGMYSEAIALLERARETGQNKQTFSDALAYAYVMAGRAGGAQQMIVELKSSSKKNTTADFSLGLIYAALGDMDRAFAHFEKQDREWRRLLFGLRLDPRLDRLRADSRYTDLLKRRLM
jgi:DNA-binding winged helix-turn-helix (wHTH) protein/TolB-like protein/Flp pilus assembly protein TadD